MRAWLQDQLITVEGTPEEWHSLVERIYAAYKEYHSTDEVVRKLVEHLKETAMVERKQAVSNKRPDMEWYDEHLK